MATAGWRQRAPTMSQELCSSESPYAMLNDERYLFSKHTIGHPALQGLAKILTNHNPISMVYLTFMLTFHSLHWFKWHSVTKKCCQFGFQKGVWQFFKNLPRYLLWLKGGLSLDKCFTWLILAWEVYLSELRLYMYIWESVDFGITSL